MAEVASDMVFGEEHVHVRLRASHFEDGVATDVDEVTAEELESSG